MDKQDQLIAEVAKLWEDPQSRTYLRAAHDEVHNGEIVRLKETPTIKRLVELAKGIL